MHAKALNQMQQGKPGNVAMPGVRDPAIGNIVQQHA
jgi:hypothetical protein